MDIEFQIVSEIDSLDLSHIEYFQDVSSLAQPNPLSNETTRCLKSPSHNLALMPNNDDTN